MLHPFSIFGIGFILTGVIVMVAAIVDEIAGPILGDWVGLAAAMLFVAVFIIFVTGMIDGANRRLLMLPPPALAASILSAIALF